MASASASHLILFIASLMVAASVAGTFTSSVNQISSAIDDQSYDISGDIKTDVEVISDPAGPIYDRNGNQNVTLLVKNTGSNDLPATARNVDVILDGQYATDVHLTVLDEAQWSPGAVARLNVSGQALNAGDHRVKVVVNEDEEIFRFKI
jgi:flagellar protein FlaG